MKGIIKIEAAPNGGHQNQLCQLETIPEGWAIIPDDMELPLSFPFVGLETEVYEEPEHEEGQVVLPECERYGVPIVTAMIPGVKPEVEPVEWPPRRSTESDVWDELDAAYQEGVNDV